MVQINRDYLEETLADLVRINSVNPSLVPGAPGEGEAARYVARCLAQIGAEVRTLEATAGRPSVVGTLCGTGGGRSLMLNAHLDTVGLDGMPDALTPTIRNGRLYGRGAYDMKGSLAACLAVAKALAEGTPRRGDVVIAAAADEEYASLGTAEVVRARPVDAAIVTEPTEMDLCVAHKGFMWIEVETRGKAAHGSRFFEGIDANLRMGRFLGLLEGLEVDLRARPPHPLVGPPSLHAALLRGGAEFSTYAARCQLTIERRTLPGETEAAVMGEIESLLDLLRTDPTFQATARPLLTRNAFEVPADAAIVEAVRAAAGRLGRVPQHIGKPFWMDSAILADAGIQTTIIGPKGGGAHTAEEWVDLQSLAALAEILVESASAYCR
ncbi:MAG TPA: M20/M25/M40 family metallo-hydrolase [Candidatus Baltobacteraceae bacterium]|nr:M20/M25/M40 family metallo-hydrolase [Candidatus Baltobacteraceae bacterium]